MKHRNAIEGTQSELVRAHGMRRARYRGLAKARLQNYFIGAACNISAGCVTPPGNAKQFDSRAERRDGPIRAERGRFV